MDCTGNPSKMKNDGMDKAHEHDFTSHEPIIWNSLPKELQEKHDAMMHTRAANGSGGGLFVTKELCCETLKDETNFLKMRWHMKDACDRKIHRAVTLHVK